MVNRETDTATLHEVQELKRGPRRWKTTIQTGYHHPDSEHTGLLWAREFFPLSATITPESTPETPGPNPEDDPPPLLPVGGPIFPLA